MMMKKKKNRNQKQVPENRGGLDSKILDSIYRNPLIRELPELAAMYGLSIAGLWSPMTASTLPAASIKTRFMGTLFMPGIR